MQKQTSEVAETAGLMGAAWAGLESAGSRGSSPDLHLTEPARGSGGINEPQE